MTANLLTLTKEKREFSMNRGLLPATALTTLKKIAFTLLCCTVLMVFPAPAQTIQSIKQDPGTNNPPPLGPILDLGGVYATPPTAALPIPGGGNGTYQQYTVEFTATLASTVVTFAFREDPAFISFTNASVVDLTTSSGNLLVNGDFSTGALDPWTYSNVFGAASGGFVASGANCYTSSTCWYDGAVQAYDAISQTIGTNIGDNYEITFLVADNSSCSTDGGAPCNFSDLSTNGDITDTQGNGINVTVYAAGGVPPVTTVQAPLPIDISTPAQAAATLNQSVSVTTVPGQPLGFNFNFFPAYTDALTVAPGTNIDIGFNGMTQAQYQATVAKPGTAFYGTTCLTALGQLINGLPSCEVNTITATTTANPFPSGANLPQPTSGPNTRDFVFTSSYNLDPNQEGPVMPAGTLTIPRGTAPFLAELNDNEACEFPSDDPLSGHLCPQSIMTSIVDGPIKPGGTPKPAGSSQVLGCCEAEWTATPTPREPPLWTNNPSSIAVSFANSPPTTPSSPTAYQAAQGEGVSFGAVASGVVLDPTLSFTTESFAPNPTPCPTPNIWANQNPQPFTATGTLTQYNNGGTAAPFTDGAYWLLYAPQDCDKFLGLKYPGSINLGGNGTSPNLAQWFTVPFNVDLTKPTISAITLNPPGGYYAPNAPVTASMTCTDPVSNGVASGIQSCGGTSTTLTNGTGPGSFTVTAPVNTSAIGPYMFNFPAGATDVAGNSSGSPTPVPYQVVGKADLGIGMLASPVVKNGQNLTYFILVTNAGPSTAYEVVVNDTLPANTSFVSAGYSLCTTLRCLISPPTISCQSTSGSCTIGTLPVWTPKNPVVAEVQITVKVNANPNTTIKNTATVGGVANDDPNSKNNTATWQTFVTR